MGNGSVPPVTLPWWLQGVIGAALMAGSFYGGVLNEQVSVNRSAIMENKAQMLRLDAAIKDLTIGVNRLSVTIEQKGSSLTIIEPSL